MARQVVRIVVVLFLQLFADGVTDSTAAVVTGQQGPHISSLNLLLPPRTSRLVHYRLLGYNGCFSWSWDHHDLLSVEPDFNATVRHCSTSAVLTSKAPFSSRRTTAVHATDIFTGQVLRCEVFIDKISRIRIFHQSLKLDLDGVATLRIRAFDSEENEFSSLVGLQFTWQLSPVNPSGDFLAHRLAHVALKDTALADGEIETQIELEQRGLKSDLFVVRGIGAGQEQVKAQLMEPHSEDLIDIVVLTTAEAISLAPPSPVYIIPGTHLEYSLKTLRRNVATVVKLPSPCYQWTVENSSVAEIDPSMGRVVGRTHGTTTVVVEDTRVERHQQISTLHVVTPVSLRLYLTPLTSKGAGPTSWAKESPIVSSEVPWHLVVARKYLVEVLAYSKESGTRPLQLTKDNDLQKLYANEGVWLVHDVPEDVASDQGWQNCSLLHTIKGGNGTLVATLAHGSMVREAVAGKWLPVRKEVLREEQRVVVCTPVHITVTHLDEFGTVLLPWIPGHGQQYHLYAGGGCGESSADYWWLSSNPDVVSVDALGVIKAEMVGRASIRVSAIRDTSNYYEVPVDVSMPTFIDTVAGLAVEVELPGSLLVAVTLLNPGGKRYTQCESLSPFIQWEISGGEATFVQINRSNEIFPIWGTEVYPCGWRLLLATKAGRATVNAILEIRDAPFGSESLVPTQPLKCSWIIAAYLPMWVEQVGMGNSFGGYAYRGGSTQDAPGHAIVPYDSLSELSLVVGTSMKVAVQGGPERWRHGVEFVQSILGAGEQTETSSVVALTHLSEDAGRLYLLSCVGFGNQTVTFNRGNLVGNDHPTRVIASVSLLVSCGAPFSISLLVDQPENSPHLIASAAQADRDVHRVYKTRFTVINNRTIRVSAVAMTGLRAFANASSLYLNWSLHECKGLARWQLLDEPHVLSNGGSWERFLELSNRSGECFVSATVGGFTPVKFTDDDTLSYAISKMAVATSFLRDVAPLQLVSALRLEPRKVVLFPSAKATISVLGGTSDIESHIEDSKVAVLSHQPPADGLVQIVVSARGLGTCPITVRDIGLATPSEASAMVVVTDVAWVKILIREDASIPLGSNLTIYLEAGDEAGYIFDSSQFPFMDVEVHQQDDILEVIKTPTSAPLEISTNSFVVRGASVGVTSTLHVSLRRPSGQEILSDYIRVGVFPPVSIHPSRLVIPPGGTYVFHAQGGPRVGVAVEFSSCDLKVATIDLVVGRLKAVSPGFVKICVQARMPGGLIVTEDCSEVQVQSKFVPLLNVRGGQLGVGREMSIFPTGLEEDLLSFIELCADYRWSVADEEVLYLRHLESRLGCRWDDQVKLHNRTEVQYWALSNRVYGCEGFSGSEDGFSARVVGRSAGTTRVTVSFTCRFGSGDGNPEPKLYTASDTILVVPPLPLALGTPFTWQFRPQYTSSRLLPQCTGQFPAQGDTAGIGKTVLYTVMHDESEEPAALSLTTDGRIRTMEHSKVACVHARDRNTGRTEIAACVRVAEWRVSVTTFDQVSSLHTQAVVVQGGPPQFPLTAVAQLMVGDSKFPYHVAELSIGSSQRYIVTLADELGSPFSESGRGISMLVLETNRADLVSAEVSDCDHSDNTCNLTITIQALRQGSALVRVSFKDLSHVVDFISIKVGTFVTPRNPSLHVGGQINFTVDGKGLTVAGALKSERDRWTTDNPNVLRIDSHTGQGEAVGEGAASGSHLTTYTSITVAGITSVTVEAPSDVGQLTNVGCEEGYRFLVTFSNAEGSDVGTLGDNQEVSYECRLRPSFLGLAVPWREPGSSTFFCVFFSYSPVDIYQLEENQKSVSSTGGSNGTMQLSIIAVVPGDPPLSGSLETTIVGGFQIVNTPSQLHISPTTNRSLVTVIGNSGDIRVTWNRTDVMIVKKISDGSSSAGIACRVVYEVKLSAHSQPFTDNVVFSLSASGQKEERMVAYGGEIKTAPLLTKPVLTAVILVVTLLVLTLIFCARMIDLPPSPPPPPPPPPPAPPLPPAPLDGTESRVDTSLSGPAEQTPSPPRGLPHNSPPQHYTNYISKTLEKTPYYRVEGFRRFDPSRTY